LAKFNIPYDEIHFGKPDADIYVDDLAVNALVDTEKEIGWYLEDFRIEPKPKAAPVEPRSFNTVVEIDNQIIKQSSAKSFEGEVYFYKNLPKELSQYFPKIFDIEYVAATTRYSVKMQKISGPTFSHLVTHRCLTEGRFVKMLNNLHEIHNFRKPSDTPVSEEINIYANYSSKVTGRFREYQNVYDGLLGKEDSQKLYSELMAFLEDYEKGKRGIFTNVIHGDPVFSNILLTSAGSIYFIDMRGCVGDVFTLSGDRMYDFAKVYQSLCGYDFFLLGEKLDNGAQKYLNSLQMAFRYYLEQNYPTVKFKDVEKLTASLLFSLIPLHGNYTLQRNCLETAKKLLF